MPEILLPAGYFAGFLILIYYLAFFKDSGLPWKWLMFFFILKVMAGEAAFLIYSYHEYFIDTSDAFRFFRDGRVIYDSFFHEPKAFFALMSGFNPTHLDLSSYTNLMPSWFRSYDSGVFNDSRTIVRLNALLYFLSKGSFHVHLIIANILSFIGLINIYGFFHDRMPSGRNNLVLLAVFMLPSLLFWGSIFSKEALAIFATGFFFYGTGKISARSTCPKAVISLILGISMLMILKVYLLCLLVPLGLSFIFNERNHSVYPLSTYFILLTGFLLAAIMVHLFVPSFEPARWLLQKQKDFFTFARINDNLNFLSAMIPSSGIFSLIVKSPLALLWSLTALFFPPVFNFWSVLAAIENLFILCLLICLAGKMKIKKQHYNLVVFCLLFALFDFLIIGLTTPYAGAIQRYRVISMIFLIAGMSIPAEVNFPALINKMNNPANTE